MSNLEFPEALDRKTLGADPERDRAPKPSPSPGGRQAPLQKRLQEAIGGMGVMIALANEIDGMAIIEGAERLSIALDKAAKQSPAFKRTLEAVLTGGVWAEVAFASGAIIVPIALNHGLVPASVNGALGIRIPASDNGDSPT